MCHLTMMFLRFSIVPAFLLHTRNRSPMMVVKSEIEWKLFTGNRFFLCARFTNGTAQGELLVWKFYHFHTNTCSWGFTVPVPRTNGKVPLASNKRNAKKAVFRAFIGWKVWKQLRFMEERAHPSISERTQPTHTTTTKKKDRGASCAGGKPDWGFPAHTGILCAGTAAKDHRSRN